MHTRSDQPGKLTFKFIKPINTGFLDAGETTSGSLKHRVVNALINAQTLSAYLSYAVQPQHAVLTNATDASSEETIFVQTRPHFVDLIQQLITNEQNNVVECHPELKTHFKAEKVINTQLLQNVHLRRLSFAPSPEFDNCIRYCLLPHAGNLYQEIFSALDSHWQQIFHLRAIELVGKQADHIEDLRSHLDKHQVSLSEDEEYGDSTVASSALDTILAVEFATSPAETYPCANLIISCSRNIDNQEVNEVCYGFFARANELTAGEYASILKNIGSKKTKLPKLVSIHNEALSYQFAFFKSLLYIIGLNETFLGSRNFNINSDAIIAGIMNVPPELKRHFINAFLRYTLAPAVDQARKIIERSNLTDRGLTKEQSQKIHSAMTEQRELTDTEAEELRDDIKEIMTSSGESRGLTAEEIQELFDEKIDELIRQANKLISANSANSSKVGATIKKLITTITDSKLLTTADAKDKNKLDCFKDVLERLSDDTPPNDSHQDDDCSSKDMSFNEEGGYDPHQHLTAFIDSCIRYLRQMKDFTNPKMVLELLKDRDDDSLEEDQQNIQEIVHQKLCGQYEIEPTEINEALKAFISDIPVKWQGRTLGNIFKLLPSIDDKTSLLAMCFEKGRDEKKERAERQQGTNNTGSSARDNKRLLGQFRIVESRRDKDQKCPVAPGLHALWNSCKNYPLGQVALMIVVATRYNILTLGEQATNRKDIQPTSFKSSEQLCVSVAAEARNYFQNRQHQSFTKEMHWGQHSDNEGTLSWKDRDISNQEIIRTIQQRINARNESSNISSTQPSKLSSIIDSINQDMELHGNECALESILGHITTAYLDMIKDSTKSNDPHYQFIRDLCFNTLFYYYDIKDAAIQYDIERRSTFGGSQISGITGLTGRTTGTQFSRLSRRSLMSKHGKLLPGVEQPPLGQYGQLKDEQGQLRLTAGNLPKDRNSRDQEPGRQRPPSTSGVSTSKAVRRERQARFEDPMDGRATGHTAHRNGKRDLEPTPDERVTELRKSKKQRSPEPPNPITSTHSSRYGKREADEQRTPDSSKSRRCEMTTITRK